MNDIKIGTMVRGNGGKALRRLEPLLSRGFETWQIHWWADVGDEDLEATAAEVRELLGGASGEVSALGLYGNPLRPDVVGAAALDSIKRLIRAASGFGCSMVGLFTGRIPGTRWEESLPRYRKVFPDLCRLAADSGVRLALENCPMGGNTDNGDWNLAFGPEEWTRLFDELPSDAAETIGLEWEPAHQLLMGKEPLTQLALWVDRVIHVHGKDAVLKAGEWVQTLPGRGLTDWARVFDILSGAGFRGSMDIEGYHDPEWTGEKEISGQIRSLEYLRECRNGEKAGPNWTGGGENKCVSWEI